MMRLGPITAFLSGLLCVLLLAHVWNRPSDSSAEPMVASYEVVPAVRDLTKQIALPADDQEFLERQDKVIIDAVQRLESSARMEETRARYLRPDVVTPPSTVASESSDSSELKRENEVLESQQQALVVRLSALKKELEEARASKERMAEMVSQLRAELRDMRKSEQGEARLQEKLSLTKRELESAREQYESFRVKMEKSQASVAQCQGDLVEKEKLLSRLPEVRDRFDDIKTSLNKTESELLTCSDQLDMQKSLVESIPEMKRRLIAAKNEMLLKDSEIEILKKGANPETLAAVAKLKEAQRGLEAARKKVQKPSESAEEVASANTENTANKMVVLEVTVNKANLRAGPGEEHSSVMQVAKKTRLTVEARQGDWYRVYTPTGARAYIRSDIVQELEEGAEASALSAAEQVSQARAQLSRKAESETDETALVPFGTVNISSKKPSKMESRALDMLKSGIGKRPNPRP